MIDGHPPEYAHGQHGQDSNNSSGGSTNWYCPPRSSPSLPSSLEGVKRQSALAALDKATSITSLVSSGSSVSSTPSAPPTSSITTTRLLTTSHNPGDKPITSPSSITSPTTPRGVLIIPTLPLHLAPSSSTPASPTSPQSQMSSSPSTTAFVTPASSLGEGGGRASQHPSIPPSPNPRSSQSQSQSTLAAALAALHPQNPNPSPISSIRPISNRPAPPSPISISRRQSTRSTISTRSGSGNLSISGPVSRPVSGLVLFPDIKAEKEEIFGAVNDENVPDSAAILSSTTEKPHSSPFFDPSSSPVSISPIKPQPPRPAIIIRDYAFVATDDRYRGIGPFVPKWNKVERLIRILVDAARDDEEAREKRRQKKERKERKKSEGAKRKKKNRAGNGWSESESEGDNDNGWSSSDSGSRRTSDESSDSSDESGDDGGGELFDERNDGFGQEGYHHHNPFYQAEQDYDDQRNDTQEDSYPEDYSEDIPSGPLLPGLYRALYAFEPEGEAEMGLDEGQVVRVVGRGGGVGWAVVVDEREGRTSLGLGGHALVPESYLEVVEEDDG